MSQRVKGQEVELFIIKDGRVVTSFSEIRSFEIEWQLELKSEGYLGETTNRKDSVFNGIRGKIEIHSSNKDVFDVVQALVDKARRRTAGTIFKINATLKYPNGDRPRISIPDVEFGGLPMNISSRTDYVSFSLDFEASEALIF